MALSEDQKAVLRLLAQRGEQGYEDLSALLGVDAAEVHARAQKAAKELESEGIPAPEIPPLPGGAAPAPAQTEESPPPEPAATPTPPRKPVEAKGEPEEKPAKPAPVAKPAAPETAATSRSRLKLPESRGARFAIAANVIAVLAIILIVVLSAGDDSGDNDNAANATPETATNLPAATGKNVTKAILTPVDGGSGSGVAVFGRVKNRLVLQIAAEGLEPSADGESYTVWLSQSPEKMLPLAATKVTENGRIAASAEIPVEILGFLASETFDDIAITRTDDQRLEDALKVATNRKDAPSYTGTEVLRGTVTGPIVGAANREGEQP